MNTTSKQLTPRIYRKIMAKLSEIKAGHRVKIIHFGDDPTVRFKLISLGILPGDPIDVISCAPFGGPQVIGHGEAQSFAIRKEASQFVEVELWTK